MAEPNDLLNFIVDLPTIQHYAQQINIYAIKLQTAYENLLTRYEQLSPRQNGPKMENPHTTPPANPHTHKRRKANESIASNDSVNKAIQDGVIETTPESLIKKRKRKNNQKNLKGVSLLDCTKKPKEEPIVDSCPETFFDGTPRTPVADVVITYVRQQCLKTGVNSSKESSDNDKSATSPINIKLESHTKQTATTTGEITITNNNALPSSSTESSVVAVSCQTEVILIQESQKVHEIYKLSDEVLRCCCDISIDSTVFVDLGCGVGHLTQFLHRQFAYKILGIEADVEPVKTARNIQKSKFSASQNSVKFAEHFVGPDSASFLQTISAKEFCLNESPDLILTGLHACADLTVDALNLFLRTPNVKKLIVMPCCYHKMKYKENCAGEFENVPLSQLLKSAQFVKDIVNRPFLRLAGQQTASRWRHNTESEHAEHGRNMFVRGVIQAVLNEDEAIVKSKKIKSQSDDYCTSESILGQYSLIHKLTKKEKNWSSNQKTNLENLLASHRNGAVLSEFITCLQASIQSICENLVIFDRLLYAKEEAAKLQLNVNITAKKIVNENISPRCFVIIAEKNK